MTTAVELDLKRAAVIGAGSMGQASPPIWPMQGLKTDNRHFSAMLCVSSVDALITYYETFKRKKQAGEHDLRVATIFTYGPNDADPDANGEIGDPEFDPSEAPVDGHKRDRLMSFVADYNAMYQTKDTVKDGGGFYTYYNHLSQRLKNRERKDKQDTHGARGKDRLDILLVVNMFLTGFDAKKLNTLYVDKNLKYHGLIQAFSRTNRILGERKSHGNIVCFRNLKPKTDEAITLFSNKDAIETVLMAPYEEYLQACNAAIAELIETTPTPDAVNDLQDENDMLAFVKAYRKIIRLMNVLESFTDHDPNKLDLTVQQIKDFNSKYLDLRDIGQRSDPDSGASILNEVDFELELIQRDEINVAYILALLANIRDDENSLDPEVRDAAAQKRKMVSDLLGSDAKLRSKRELIEKFINDQMGELKTGDDVKAAFSDFWNEEKEKSIREICETEGISIEALSVILEEYHFTGKEPLGETIVSALNEQPKILERKSIVKRVTDKLMTLVRVFDNDIGDV